jgi:hypothetical protein
MSPSYSGFELQCVDLMSAIMTPNELYQCVDLQLLRGLGRCKACNFLCEAHCHSHTSLFVDAIRVDRLVWADLADALLATPYRWCTILLRQHYLTTGGAPAWCASGTPVTIGVPGWCATSSQFLAA